MMNATPAEKGIAWLIANQNDDGGWGARRETPSSIEETALATEVLLDAGPEAGTAVNKGLEWLVQSVTSGGLEAPTPIGFYFAKLWYYERLYPIVFSVAALGRALSHRARASGVVNALLG
jgi:squalene-hopene/tetraprenyl-beta-curcumene cyclase